MTRTIPLLLLALGLVAPRTAAAQSRDACSGEQTNLAIRKCLNREAARADTTLARSVDSLARSMDDSGAVRLRRVEELWVRYRDAQCSAVAGAYDGGSMAPVAQLQCMVVLSVDRKRFLANAYPRDP